MTTEQRQQYDTAWLRGSGGTVYLVAITLKAWEVFKLEGIKHGIACDDMLSGRLLGWLVSHGLSSTVESGISMKIPSLAAEDNYRVLADDPLQAANGTWTAPETGIKAILRRETIEKGTWTSDRRSTNTIPKNPSLEDAEVIMQRLRDNHPNAVQYLEQVTDKILQRYQAGDFDITAELYGDTRVYLKPKSEQAKRWFEDREGPGGCIINLGQPSDALDGIGDFNLLIDLGDDFQVINLEGRYVLGRIYRKRIEKADPEQIDWILEYAKQHGLDSEPDHEVGDLQEALAVAMYFLTEGQRVEVVEILRSEYDWGLLDEDEEDEEDE